MNDFEKIEFVTWQARAAMLKYLSAETCIISTRIVSQLLTNLLGVKCQPLPVSAVAMNDAGKQMANEGAKLQEIIKAPDTFTAVCKHLGVNADIPGEWWGGHLTMVVEGAIFIDASADQFTIPEAKGSIVCPGPIISTLPDPEAFFFGDRNLAFALKPGAVAYTAEASDLSYLDSQDWEEPIPGDRLYDFVATTVEGLLDLYADAEFTEVPTPALPETVSRATAGRDLLQKREMIAVTELGYTLPELEAREKREKEREVRRAQRFEERKDSLTPTQLSELATVQQARRQRGTTGPVAAPKVLPRP